MARKRAAAGMAGMAGWPGGATKPGMRWLTLALILLPGLALGQVPASPRIMQDVKAGNFPQAGAAAAATGDPLMVKLVTFYRLLAPGGGTVQEIQEFIDDNPDWPDQGLLALRLNEAGGAIPENNVPPPSDFLTRAEALHEAGEDQQAAALWASQGAAAAASAPVDQRRLFWPDQNALARALLGAGDAKDAYAVVTAVTPPPGGDGQSLDAEFLAGFLALRFLHEPALAAGWFTALANGSTAVITQARAWYWLARCNDGAAAAADYARAARYPDTYYGQLAALALGDSPATLADMIRNAAEPATDAADVFAFAAMELPRAAALLVQMDDPQDAAIFLDRLGQTAMDDRTRELGARLALGLGLPQSAVSIARTAGAEGQMLIREGWPTPYSPPSTVEPAIADGIMRQESSFDPTALSGAEAEGLMQLLPETARLTATRNGIPYDGNLNDPTENMALGTAYLAGLIRDFGNCLPLAIAAYNAGPSNVANWLAEAGDPELGSNPGGADLIDWIEEIPFNETRNYVQRVTESIVVYRALLNGSADSPLARWLAPGQGAAS